MSELVIKISRWNRLLLKSIASCFKLAIMSSKAKSYRAQKAESKRLVILGNGPSAKSTMEENREFFSNTELICLNHFPISEYYRQFKPKYYIAIAHDLYLDNVDAKFVDASNKLFKSIAENTTWELKVFMPFEARKHERWQSYLKTNSNIQIVYFNTTPVEGFKNYRYRCYNKAKGMPRPHNIMVPAIFTAINLNVKEIVIIGADHTWLQNLHVDENNQALFVNEHFYDADRKAKRFDYMGQSFLKMHEILHTLSVAFEGYHILKEYAENKNIEIINSTPVSNIDAFKRCDIKDLKNEI